ncbi:FG-GAP-like repeat-containing protein [Spirosoma oryzicola]|uniref:FG-GAP-like repeat-containing protein n=1 Tax=Spirosoma oryzicola TaxID=2898794 RepID=UPI001E2D625C|nr:FG-GAP-like repeat-containing protein [Spirosoma oryzicola]UHG90205.1 FG-GAP-like repeat-containing protein [Spirosoma oryzicola]
MTYRYLYFVLLFLSSYLITSCQSSSNRLFSLLPASETGITFANRITNTDSTSILDVEYFYNGGGVALGDFNKDGLPDVFFTGNQVANRLYLNKGDFKFDDISTSAGITGNGKWCSGATLIDINNDGWLDIYVSATLSKSDKQRENLLYVNQGLRDGKPVFREMAHEYGIADDSHTTNAAFFDYDNDGDLDLYLLTDRIDESPNVYRTKVSDGSSLNADRLYRNDFDKKLGHPFFTNVSKQAGIVHEGYGLGLNITDINRDGWKDIYVTNDYVSDDLMYINNHDGTFTDRAAEYFKHTSNTAMGNDVTDINNDGLVDVLALDMLPRDNYRKKMLLAPNNYQTYLYNDEYKFNYQVVRNTLQLNQGPRPNSNTPAFSEISLLADVAETDWSWTPMAADFDHDGFRDLIITNGFPQDVTDRDFMTFITENANIATKDYKLSQIPVVKISNYAFHNNGDLTFSDVTQNWGIDNPSFSNGAAYGDLDNDGDLDYIVNNINDSAFVYRNNLIERKPEKANYLRVKFAGPTSNPMGLGAFVELHYGENNGQQQVYEHSPYRGYLSTVEPVAHFGLGSAKTISEVRIIWPGTGGQAARQQILRNVKANQVLIVDSRNAHEPVPAIKQPSSLFHEVTDSLKIAFQHEEPEYIDFNNQKLLPHKFSQYGPSVSVGDVNGDGLDDLFIGGSKSKKGHFLIQTAAGSFVDRDLLPEQKGPEDKPEEDMGTLLFDADGDGDLDLYIASGSIEGQANTTAFQDRLYINDGPKGSGKFILSPGAIPQNVVSKSCVKAADFDRDGDLDLFIGGRVEPDHYPKPVSSFILRNDGGSSKTGTPHFTDVTKTVAPGLQTIGLVCDALWTDSDNDGWPDLLLAGEFMPLTLLKNQRGKLEKTTSGLEGQKGWWNSLVAGDFDRDGDIDYIAGNLGRNARMRASDTEPVRVYAGDFDNNGFYDAIPTIFIPDADGKRKEYSFHGREDLIKQMIAMRRRFPYFKDFTTASIDRLLTPEERQSALVLEANYLESAYVENKGDGTFALHTLPTQAQLGPIFGMVAEDVDRDGNLDVVLVGNDYGGEVFAGRYDALNGLVLRGDGKGNFIPQSIASSGLFVPGNAKGLAQFTDSRGRELVVATQNRGRLCLFRNSKPAASLRLRPTDASALLTFADGKRQKVEFTYGSSFLSQSARTLLLSPLVKAVEITDSQGHKRQERPRVDVALK